MRVFLWNGEHWAEVGDAEHLEDVQDIAEHHVTCPHEVVQRL